MTENESLSLLGKSPFETAAQLLWYTGNRVRAQRIVTFQLRSLLSLTKVYSLPVCFWADVLRRLDRLLDTEAAYPDRFQYARFESIEARMAR